MNPQVEQILLNWIKGELQKNPQLAGNFLLEILKQLKVDPTLATVIIDLLDQLLPVILSGIKP